MEYDISAAVSLLIESKGSLVTRSISGEKIKSFLWILPAVACFATAAASNDAKAQTEESPVADFQVMRRAPTHGGVVAKWKLGVYSNPVVYYEPLIGGNVNGLQIRDLVRFGSAERHRFDRGDIITRINNVPVRNLVELTTQLDQSNGTVTIRIRDIRSGTYADVPNVALDPASSPPVPQPQPQPPVIGP